MTEKEMFVQIDLRMSIRDEESRPQTNWQTTNIVGCSRSTSWNGSTMGRNLDSG